MQPLTRIHECKKGPNIIYMKFQRREEKEKKRRGVSRRPLHIKPAPELSSSFRELSGGGVSARAGKKDAPVLREVVMHPLTIRRVTPRSISIDLSRSIFVGSRSSCDDWPRERREKDRPLLRLPFLILVFHFLLAARRERGREEEASEPNDIGSVSARFAPR